MQASDDGRRPWQQGRWFRLHRQITPGGGGAALLFLRSLSKEPRKDVVRNPGGLVSEDLLVSESGDGW